MDIATINTSALFGAFLNYALCVFYVQFVVKFILLFFVLLYFRSMKKEQNKFDNKLNIKDAWWLAKEYII